MLLAVVSNELSDADELVSAFYPGAGTDVFPLNTFRHIKRWIFTDSQSNRPIFIGLLIQNMKQNEFELESINGDDSYIFYNKEHDQQVIYETNSVFPRDIQQRHYACDYIVLCGFDMEDKTIEFINRFQQIITNNITSFELDAKQLLSSKNVSVMCYHKDWEYWDDKNKLPHLIQQYIRVTNWFDRFVR